MVSRRFVLAISGVALSVPLCACLTPSDADHGACFGSLDAEEVSLDLDPEASRYDLDPLTEDPRLTLYYRDEIGHAVNVNEARLEGPPERLPLSERAPLDQALAGAGVGWVLSWREHTLTPAESESLSASLGHPRYDPHGDPIPAADGSLPPASGVPLATLRPGAVATILHVEDEPAPLYERLVSAGLGPGTRVEVLAADGGAFRIRAAGRDHALEPVVVANVSVQPLTEAPREADVETLDALRPGERGRVVRIAAACQGPARQRLLDLGVVPGTVIEARYAGMSGDPVAYEIRGALIGLRRSQAATVLVRRDAAGVAA
ncbi:MAG: metal-dependent transcriptional regulator [Gemmatimonadetes bacterium]|nr:metal-dependent transcriptional regulator [Gemmatimonadota bacterium]